jgi:hypothetical protein
MADTRLDIGVPANMWVNIYTATGIPVGTAVDIFNKGTASCNLVIRPTQPTVNTMGIPLGYESAANYRHVSGGESGLWVFSAGTSTYLCVQETA